jgi:hypothetical protein
MHPMTESFLAGSRNGFEGAALAHWALAKAGCSEPWVSPWSPGAAGRLVTHADPYRPDVPTEPGDILLAWTHPHGADAQVGCVVAVNGRSAIVLGTREPIWSLDDQNIKGVLRAGRIGATVQDD